MLYAEAARHFALYVLQLFSVLHLGIKQVPWNLRCPCRRLYRYTRRDSNFCPWLPPDVLRSRMSFFVLKFFACLRILCLCILTYYRCTLALLASLWVEVLF